MFPGLGSTGASHCIFGNTVSLHQPWNSLALLMQSTHFNHINLGENSGMVPFSTRGVAIFTIVKPETYSMVVIGARANPFQIGVVIIFLVGIFMINLWKVV